jgi:hypothetical protein
VKRRRGWIADGICVLGLFVVAIAVASWYVPRYVAGGGKPRFYQEEFGAAAMAACGRGFVNPDASASPALADFLERRRDEITCSEVTAAPELPLRPMQRAFRYLMLAVGQTWRIEGRVAWSELTPLFALMYAATVVLAFAIFRQGMGRVIAFVGAALIAGSTLHLTNLPHLRDYSKAPFVLLLVLIAIRVVVKPLTPRATYTMAAAAGLATGIGVGFRNDVLVAIPAFVAIFLVFLPGPLRAQLLLRTSAAALYLFAIAVAMFPMLSVYNTGGGSSSQHLVLLGLTPAFSRELGVTNSRLYEWGFEYRDELALAMINDYASRRLGQDSFLPMYGAGYDRAAGAYLQDIASGFPGDLVTRAYASAVRITELPYLASTSAILVPPYVDGTARRWFETRNAFIRYLKPFWPWALAFTVMAITTVQWRLGVFAGLCLLYVAAYPALQFQERHFFHLEFVAWWALGFAVSLIAALTMAAFKRRHAELLETWRPSAGWLAAAGRAVAIWGVIAVAFLATLWMARSYQREHGVEQITAIANAPRTPLTTSIEPGADGRVRMVAADIGRGLPPGNGVHAAYVSAGIGGPGCDRLQVNVMHRYDAAPANYDLSHPASWAVPLGDQPLRVFFPAYFLEPSSAVTGSFRFSGLETSPEEAACIRDLSIVDNPAQFPVLMEMQLPPAWQEVTPYATITGVEGRWNPARVHTSPEGLSRLAVQQAFGAAPVEFRVDDIADASGTFAMAGSKWTVSGAGGVGGRGPFLYLARMKPRKLERGATFVAEGAIVKGGVTFGLLRSGEWVSQVHVRETGPFAVAIQVPDEGQYDVILANNLLDMSLRNELTVSRAGLVPPARSGS